MGSHLPEILHQPQETNGPVIIQLLHPCESEALSKFTIWAQTFCEAHLQYVKFSKWWQDHPRETARVIPFLPEIFVLISTVVSVLSFLCVNRWQKRNSPKTLVPYDLPRHERGVLTRNQLLNDGRNSPKNPYAPRGEGLKATRTQLREL